MSRPTAIVTALHNHVFRGDRISLPPTDSLDALMLGANLGLALFDGELRLLACNDLYLSLCGYEPTDVTPGVSLKDLMRKSMPIRTSPEVLSTRGSTASFPVSPPLPR
jgi:PAS domain-containing protein